MYVKKIEYYNFRNIDRAKIEPSESVTLLYGKNAEGKTIVQDALFQVVSITEGGESKVISFGFL
jgi:recombinational DNA repair ATPase RecF